MTPRKILFTDKVAASRRFVAELPGQQVNAIQTAASGAEGLQASARDEPDLTPLDPVPVDLPGDPIGEREDSQSMAVRRRPRALLTFSAIMNRRRQWMLHRK
jgi:hypothetical protein